MTHTTRSVPTMLAVLTAAVWLGVTSSADASAGFRKADRAPKPTRPMATALRYAEAVAGGDQVQAGQLDFACLYKMVSSAAKPLKTFPAPADPIYKTCWDRLAALHDTAIEQRSTGTDEMWPGKGSLVFFRDALPQYAASFFVMNLVGQSPPGSGVKIEPLDSAPLPAASFRPADGGATVSAAATLVKIRVVYKDPLLSPITYAPGTYRWANTVKRPRAALKAVTLQWVVVKGLKRLGFPGDEAVVNVPVSGSVGGPTPPLPFVTQPSTAVEHSEAWWGPDDAPGVLLAAVGRAALFPELQTRIALLNRVLLVDPSQPEALTLLSSHLYEALLQTAATAHRLPLGAGVLAPRFNELYWDIYAQTERMDIALGMEMGGLAKPTAADYLYRMIPAMERLAQVRPADLRNRIRLGMALRWNNDQVAAITTHEALVRDIQSERTDQRAQALIELAWSRIAKVTWNRILDDPELRRGCEEAREAFTLTTQPLDKFVAAYEEAYCLAFMPKRDNHAVLERLTESRRWFQQLPGATDASWRFLLGNDNVKGLLEADPIFKPLLADSKS